MHAQYHLPSSRHQIQSFRQMIPLRALMLHCRSAFSPCVAIAAIAFGLTACADTIPINYAPSSTLTATGTVEVGSFTYLPATTGKVAPNQIRNTALGQTKFDRNIDVIFHDAVFTELRFVGVKVDGSNRQLKGEIREFLIDDLGFDVDWTVDVQYVVTDKATGSILFQAEKSKKNKTSKFANPFGALNEQIKGNIEDLIKDPDFINAIK